MPRGPAINDINIGGRVRLQRMKLGMSQTELGAKVGVTFQQIQKYEKGVNRIGSGRLQQMSGALGVKPEFFFDVSHQSGNIEEDDAVKQFLMSRIGLKIATSFHNVSDEVKPFLGDLIEALGTARTPVITRPAKPAKKRK